MYLLQLSPQLKGLILTDLAAFIGCLAAFSVFWMVANRNLK
jgi:hypothetical protein